MLDTRSRARRALASGTVVASVLVAACDLQPTSPEVPESNVATRPMQAMSAPIRVKRIIEPGELGITNPGSITFSPRAGDLLVVARTLGQPGRAAGLELISPAAARKGSLALPTGEVEPFSTAYDARANRLLILQAADGVLVEIPGARNGTLEPDALRGTDIQALGLEEPRGMTVDPNTGALFVLDAAGPRIVRIDPDPVDGFDAPELAPLDLVELAGSDLRGLAWDPTDGHLYVLDPDGERLYELTEWGGIVAVRDISGMVTGDPSGMTFAPSGDATDDPSVMSLYVTVQAEGSGGTVSLAETGQIVEMSVEAAASAPSPTETGTLIQTIETSQFSPPSPDPAGITYSAVLGDLLVSDSEVNEMSIFQGVNVFQMSANGNLNDTFSTLSFSNEPTGITWNPSNNHLFFSDDTGTRSVYELDPGSDGQYGTSDDVVTSIATNDFGSGDPEGVTFDTSQGVLFIVDGVNEEVYRVAPGPNGLFDGVDDVVTSWDTGGFGLTDPEGIAYDAGTGHLFLVGKPTDLVFRVTTSGSVINTIDISAANADKPAGLVYAPSSGPPGNLSLWIVDRRVDNGSNPNENDGEIYEFSLPSSGGNAAPWVTIMEPTGSPYPQGQTIQFTGSAFDLEDGDLTAGLTWTSDLDGVIGTGASFSTSTLSPGTHMITASVTDSGSSEGSSVREVTVLPPGSYSMEVRVNASTDDAEESAAGAVDDGSSDLELVFDGDNQTVGLKFNGVAIPAGVLIANATIQFQADESHSGATSLTIEGEATDHAATFTSDNFNISSRPRTTSSVAWSPLAWNTGEAGPSQQTPNIASVIQEIVNRPGWSSGNSLAVIITGTGRRTAESQDGDPTAAALLHVDYVLGGGNSAPTATNVQINSIPEVGQTITGSYTYGDADGDAEGASTYRWLRDGVAIPGATTTSYTLVSADEGAMIVFEVTPVALTGASPGVASPSPAVGPVGAANTVPTASNVQISGTTEVGFTLTGSYTYSDADGDAEGASTYRWLRGGTPIGGATTTSYTLQPADQGAMIVFEVTPVAVSGASPGAASPSPAVGPVGAANTVPTATNVQISGTIEVGFTLTGSYTYNDGDGDAEGASTHRWLRNGSPIGGATTTSYQLVGADEGAMIVFEVTPVAQTGASPGSPTGSPSVGPVAPANTPPTATNVQISGTTEVGFTLTGSYTYGDADSDAEGTSTYRWLRDGVAITGATTTSYTLVALDEGAMIVFEVTPVAVAGPSPGTPSPSAAVGPIAPANTPPTASNVQISGTTEVGFTLTGSYTYGDADGDAEGASTYRWLRNGSAIGGATTTSYQLVGADEGAMIAFEVTPVAQTGASPGTATPSPAVGPIAPGNSAPTASNVQISGTPEVGFTLTGSYTYGDVDGDPEGTSTFRWLRDGVPITGATTTSHTLVALDEGALIVFEVTPVAQTGASPGAPSPSPSVGPVLPPNGPPTSSNVQINGTPEVNLTLTGSYTYSDLHGDPEGTSTFRWLRDGVEITGATTTSYTLVAGDEGAMIVFEVTPVAQTGPSPGTPTSSPAVGPVAPPNTPPTASNVQISGTPEVGLTLTGSYTYSDAHGDPEGTSTFRWLRDGVAITGATATTYSLVGADVGAMITFEVTPVAQTGPSPGTASSSPSVGPVAPANTPPTASNVVISGTPEVGQTLTGSYTYGDADGDSEGTSTFRWLRDGVAITGATTTSYALVGADVGAMITFEVTPVAQTGPSPGTPAASPSVGPVAPGNTPPTASNVQISGTPRVGQTLTGSYTYSDANGDAEGTSTFRWLRGGVAIAGATTTSYTLAAADAGALIVFEVTPVALTGPSPGTPTASPSVGPVALAVASMTPNTAGLGASIGVTITGAGFAPGATITFENGSGPAPSVQNVVVVNGTTITATVTTKSGGPPRNRVWDVRVTNPSGASGVLAGGFTITP